MTVSVDDVLAAWSRELPAAVRPSSELSKTILDLARHLREAIAVAVAEHELTMAEYDILTALRRGGAPFSRRPTDLAAELLLSSGGTTKALSTLEKRALVVREAHERDRRSVRVRLTDHGVVVAEKALLASTAAQADLVGAVPTDDLRETTAVVRELAEHVRSAAASVTAPRPGTPRTRR